MSSSSNLAGTGNCSCGVQATSEPSLSSGPGLSALPYRVGTYATFQRRMLDQLAVQTVPPGDPAATNRPLAALKTRASSDPTVSLIDAWSMVMDVFTFYQERIVNEAYLSTATERLSVLELGRASGYELHPGVAATCYLAFTAEDSASAPKVAAVPAGTKVQSLPGPGETPQTFETMADLGARASWNQLRPRQTQPQELNVQSSAPYLTGPGATGEWPYLYLAGSALNIKVGDMLLLIDRTDPLDPNAVKTLCKLVQSVTPDAPAGRTRIGLAPGADIPTPFFPPAPSLSGAMNVVSTPLTHDYVRDNIVQRSWEESKLSAQIGIQRWNEQDLLQYISQVVAETPDSIEVYALRQRVGFFGNNAPQYDSLTKTGTAKPFYPNSAASLTWEAGESSPQRSIWRRSITTDGSGSEFIYYSADTNFLADVFLERSVPEVVPGSWVVFRSPVATIPYYVMATVDRPLSEFAVNGKATGLLLAHPQKTDTRINSTSDKLDSGGLYFRSTVAYVQSERMKLAPWPIDEPLKASDAAIVLSGMTLGLSSGQSLWLRGEQADVAGLMQDQIIQLSSVVHDEGYTTLYLKNTLGRSYRRSSVTLNANVALASHGESAAPEVLGSGDATQQNQSFELKKPNVTYLLAPTASGTQSTVTVSVNGIPWTEVVSLYALDGRSQSFTLRNSDEGTTTVIFGDGERGARLPTGNENVVATYRTCNAAAGIIAARRLSQLKTRPLGIREVTNPLPSSGNSARESIEQGRTNAPLQTQLIDRIITLRDYQGFASAYPGIAKAHAVLTWNGSVNLVHLTVAGQDGSTVPVDSPLQTNLLRAMGSVADPGQSVQIATYQPRYFVIAADLVIAQGSPSAQVIAAAQAALLSAFSFAHRSFAQDVTAAEVAMVLQSVPGVAATVLRRLALLDDTAVGGTPPARLAASDTFYDASQHLIHPAELLLLSPAGITLSEIGS